MKKILTSIWFLALIVAVPIIIFMPTAFDKYTAELISVVDKANPFGVTYFEDLQNNGVTERVEVYEAEENLLSFQVFDENNGLYNQYNFPHFYNSRLKRLFFFDVDNNGQQEVYGFTVYNDSVFLSYVEPFGPHHQFHSSFVTTINTEHRKNLDVTISEMVLFDFDNDSDEELVFSIAVGYNWFPRKIFVFHPENGQVDSSDEFGVHFYSLKPFDYNSDGQKELLCISSSADNIDPGTNVKYYDDRPRIFLIGQDLKEVVPPVEFPKGIGSRLQYEIIGEDSNELMVFYHNFTSGNAMTFASKIYADGKSVIADSLFFKRSMSKMVKMYKEREQSFFTFSTKGKVYWFDNDLDLLDSLDLKYRADCYIIGSYNIVEDGSPEFCVVRDNSILSIYFERFKHEIEIEFDKGDYTSSVIKSPKENELIIDADGKLNYYKVSSNPWYYLKYPGYIFIYLLVAGFIWLLQFARLAQLKEKLELQQKVKELQFLSLKNQLDPHFIFNTFNTIASTVKQGKNEEAYDLMVRFSKLVRINMEQSKDIYTSLEKEMKFVEDYLSIQKIRFKDQFNYVIVIEKSVRTDIQIPKLLVQIHVENALKHGIRPLKNGGMLDVKISNELAFLRIEITDNGIGRKQSKMNHSDGNGVGLKAIKQIIELNNQNRKHKISQEIIDLADENGKPRGTKVILKILV